MDRITLSQSILDAVGDGTYLELGVDSGNSFIPVRATRKWGVDPSYTLTWRRRAKYAMFSLLGLRIERLFRMTSDRFFASYGKMLTSHGIDVCLVDGLHTYEQALADVLNALRYLNPAGVILIHDSNPSTELMARPAHDIAEMIRQEIPDWHGAWSGDVWKAIVHLRSLRKDLNAFVLDCDTGIGVVTKGKARVTLPYSPAEIREMTYKELESNRQQLLDLRPQTYFDDFLREHIREQESGPARVSDAAF